MASQTAIERATDDLRKSVDALVGGHASQRSNGPFSEHESFKIASDALHAVLDGIDMRLEELDREAEDEDEVE